MHTIEQALYAGLQETGVCYHECLFHSDAQHFKSLLCFIMLNNIYIIMQW